MRYTEFKQRLSIIGLFILLISIPSIIGHGIFWNENGDGNKFMSEYVKQSSSNRARDMCSDLLFGYQGKDNFSAFNYMLFGDKSTEHNTSDLIFKDSMMRLIETQQSIAEINLPDEIGVPKGIFDNTIGKLDSYKIDATHKFLGKVRLKVGESTIVSSSKYADSNRFFSISRDTNILEMENDNCFSAKSKGTTYIDTLYFDVNGRVHKKSIKVKVKSADGGFF